MNVRSFLKACEAWSENVDVKVNANVNANVDVRVNVHMM